MKSEASDRALQRTGPGVAVAIVGHVSRFAELGATGMSGTQRG